MSFEIKIPFFEGPFDLLLFFIERDELDIHDIPISKITHDFMAYLTQLEQMNLEVASEFILTAATLMRIKAKMLLPRADKDEQGQEVDPRRELVQHLLEYKKYKSALAEFSEMEDRRMMQDKRGNVEPELEIIAKRSNLDFELQDLSLYKLMRVFEKAMSRAAEEREQPTHTVYSYPYTIEDQKVYILAQLSTKPALSFAELLEAFPDRIGLIYNFLAILEMLQLNVILVEMDEGFNNFRISASAEPAHV